MGVVGPRPLEAMDQDPDDYRPNSRWALVTDPQMDGGVDDISVIVEDVAPGDHIPLHTHAVSEAVMIMAGEAEVTLGDEKVRPVAGSTVFIPAGTVHGHRNVGSSNLRIVAFFPATTVDIKMLERNPAPGTEDQEPQHTVYDMRTGKFWAHSDVP